MTTVTDPAIVKAMASVQAAIPKAASDPARPMFHFLPPAQWMNDPNGTIYYKGYYHLFYQHNPYGDFWEHIHWGHARSHDLVHWEHLPIALWPSEEKGEAHCYSGCVWIKAQAEPRIFYTSVPPKSETARPFEQWMAIGDDDLITWQKHLANPILDLKVHGDPTWEHDWRDPFLFEESGRVFLVIGVRTKTESCIALYEATESSLIRWTYRGILYRASRQEFGFLECPNFFKLGDKWILLTSPFKPVHYFVGSFNLKNYLFTPETSGVLNYSRQFYSTNILFDSNGRCVVFGWVRGFPESKGWSGCLALPRLLTMSADGYLLQQPVPELQSLRTNHVALNSSNLNGSHVVTNVHSDTLEVIATFKKGNAKTFGLRFSPTAIIRCDGVSLELGNVKTPLQFGSDKTITLHVFVDKSVIEVFANEGRVCMTCVVEGIHQDHPLEIFAEDGNITLCSLDAWNLQPIG